MSERESEAFLKLWHRLNQIVPRVQSADTLGTAIATALRQLTGAGMAAVVFPCQPLEGEPEQRYCLRPVGAEPGHPITLKGDEGLLAQIAGREDPRTRDTPLLLHAPWSLDDALTRLAREHLVVVPIPHTTSHPDRSPGGAICLFDVPPPLLPSTAELVSLASFAGLALSLVEQKNEAARQEIEYHIISQIGRSLTSSLSLEDIFEQVMGSVRVVIDASQISVGLIDPDTQEVVLESALMGPQTAHLQPVRLKVGQGIAGWVAQSGQSLNVPDAYADPRFFPRVDQISGFVTRSILCVPLKVEGEVIGVLEAMNKHAGVFTSDDERLLTALASSVATAIDKARLHADVLAEKRRMEAIFVHMSEGLLTVNRDRKITAVNPALESMLGLEACELIGREPCKVIPTDPPVLDEMFTHIEAGEWEEETFHFACDLLRPDGTRLPTLVSGALYRGDTTRPSELVIVLSNMGPFRELERMKDDFIASITHELRTPLATILLYARLLRTGKASHDPKRQARYLRIVEEQSNQLQKLVRQILNLTRVRTALTLAAKEPIHLSSLLDNLLEPWRRMADQKGLLLETHLAPNLPPVMGNPEALRVIFENLVDNAVKFTPGGEVIISAQTRGQNVLVEVSDSGIGISPEAIPYLFQRFYRTEAAVERGIGGYGLGLALVKEAVGRLDGEITVSGRPEGGTTFSVMLPACK